MFRCHEEWFSAGQIQDSYTITLLTIRIMFHPYRVRHHPGEAAQRESPMARWLGVQQAIQFESSPSLGHLVTISVSSVGECIDWDGIPRSVPSRTTVSPTMPWKSATIILPRRVLTIFTKRIKRSLEELHRGIERYPIPRSRPFPIRVGRVSA